MLRRLLLVLWRGPTPPVNTPTATQYVNTANWRTNTEESDDDSDRLSPFPEPGSQEEDLEELERTVASMGTAELLRSLPQALFEACEKAAKEGRRWLAFFIGTLSGFGLDFALENAIGSHACSLEASKRVTNGIPLGRPRPLTVTTVNSATTVKGSTTLSKPMMIS
jgi:hypothetical protein